jgi:hypothetical protein
MLLGWRTQVGKDGLDIISDEETRNAKEFWGENSYKERTRMREKNVAE